MSLLSNATFAFCITQRMIFENWSSTFARK